MKRKLNLFTLIIIASLFAMSTANDDENSSGETQVASMLSEPLLNFTGKIFAKTNQNNVLLSPISIHKALSMVLLAADPTSQTELELIDSLGLAGMSSDQIKKCHEEYARIIAKFKTITKESLEFQKKQDEKGANDGNLTNQSTNVKPPIMDIFNMVITKDNGEVLPAYADKIKQYYDSSIVKIDDNKPETKSALIERLGNWAKEAGFEQPIMKAQDLDEKFAAILLSAIRIQGSWFESLYEYDNEKIFYNFGNSDKPVNGKVLSASEIFCKYLEFASVEKAQHKNLHARLSKSDHSKLFDELNALNFHVVEMPLKGGLSFAIFEPLDEGTDALSKLVGGLFGTGANNLSKVLSIFDSDLSANRVDRLAFPKFSFENEINLKNTLKSIGLNRVFDKMSAQVSHMTQHKVYIEKIIHQAVIDVNKFGIKAAGVTKIHLSFLSAIHVGDPIRLDIKRPFMFMIRYQQLPLFVGQLVELK